MARRRFAAGSRVAHSLEDGDLVYLGRLQVIPEDAPRPIVITLDLDNGPRGGDQVHGQIMACDHQMVAKDLDRVDRRGDDGVVVDLAGLDQDAVLEVREATALADSRPGQIDGDGSTQDEVDLGKLFERDHASVPKRALDRRRLAHLVASEALGIQKAKGMAVAQSRDGHHQGLPLLQGEPPGVGLRRVRVCLHHPRAFPGAVSHELLRGELRSREIRNPPLGPRKARYPFAIHCLPDRAPDLVLRPHRLKHSPHRGDRPCHAAWAAARMAPVSPERTSLARAAEAELAGEQARLPAVPDRTPERRRADLPAIEPERTIDDWGRSEWMESLMDRGLLDFFYHYWFRVEVEGIENVPPDGGVLLV